MPMDKEGNMTMKPFKIWTKIAPVTSALAYFTSCNMVPESQIKVSTEYGLASMTQTSPPVAKANETVAVTGKNLAPGKSYKARFTLPSGEIKESPLTVIDSTSASFALPEGLGLGEKSFDVVTGSRTINTFSIVTDEETNTLSIYTGDPSKVCSTETYIDKTGATKTGTKDCATGSTADCTADGALGCKTNASFPAASAALAVAGNIKSGVTIAGITGAYPSATYTLPSASGTADLEAANFDAQIKSATAFEYWTSDGTRQTGAGDADITAGNIANGVTVFGLSGTLSAAAPNAWDVRVGTVINGVTGKLKVNCRNRARTAVYNYDGAVGSIINTGVTSGTTIDYWDTIDDYNNAVSGLPTNVVSGWTNNDCGGVEATADDANVWKDVTTTGDGTTASTCTGAAAHCTMKDKITGLQWSKMANFSFTNSTTTNASATLVVSSTTGLVAGMVVSGTGIPASTYILNVVNGTNLTMSANATATASNVTVTVNSARWNGAVAYCDGLSYNGATDWRIPTQKELMEIYAHGVRSAASANWITEANMQNNYFWSGSSVSFSTDSAWYANLALGSYVGNKTDGFQVACVR
jgi:hypothetical protein